MKYLIVLLLSLAAAAQTTPNLHLNIPPQGTANYDVLLNQNFTTLDSAISSNTVIAGSSAFPCTTAGIIAMLTAATAQANAQGCKNLSIASEFDVPEGVVLLHPPTSIWTFGGANSAQYGIKLATGALLGGQAGVASDGAAFTLQASPTANLDSLLATDPNVSGGGYFSAENIKLYNPSGGTFANGLLHIRNAVDGSYFRNVVVANYSGIGVKMNGGDCCGMYGFGMVSNGNYGSGAQPWVFNAADTSHINVATDWFANSIDHPGAGKNNLLLTGTNRFWCHGNSFFGTYMEGASGIGDTTTAAVDDNCYGVTNFFGLTLGNDDASSTRYVLQIETGTEGVNALGIESGISTNLINDLTNTNTVSVASGYKPIDYVSVPAYFTNLKLPKGAFSGTFAPPSSYASNRTYTFPDATGQVPITAVQLISTTAPTVASGFGTSPSIVNSNGSAVFEVNVGTGGAATSGVLTMPAATTGWSCQVTDMSTNDVTRETAFTTTSVTVTAASAWTASDKLLINCGAF